MPSARKFVKQIENCEVPFKFEPTRYSLKETRESRKKILYTENRYDPRVKVSNWIDHAASLPYDHPFNPKKLLQSHYDRLGDEAACNCYTTTTSEMLRQNTLKKNYDNKSGFKHIMNYFSYKDITGCIEESSSTVPQFCVADYKSTMHASYIPPYPYIMKHLSVKKVPPLSTRRLKMPDPTKTTNKFYDEDYYDTQKILQCHKGFRYNSYNFHTHTYQNGSIPKERKQALIRLEY